MDGGAIGNAGQVLLLLGIGAGKQNGTGGRLVRDEGTGKQRAADFLDEDAEVEVAEAGPAVVLGDHEAVPAEIRHLLPQLGAVALLILFHGADVLFRALVLKELPGRVLQQLLFFAEP